MPDDTKWRSIIVEMHPSPVLIMRDIEGFYATRDSKGISISGFTHKLPMFNLTAVRESPKWDLHRAEDSRRRLCRILSIDIAVSYRRLLPRSARN